MTPKRLRVLTFIVEYRQETWFSPTYQEIADHFGITKSSVVEHIVALEKLGCITRDRSNRGIRLISSNRGIRLINGDERCPLCGQCISRADKEPQEGFQESPTQGDST